MDFPPNLRVANKMSSLNDKPAPVRAGEQLDVARLESYLADVIPNVQGRLSIQQFPSGFSNLTYCLQFGTLELVLRRPPFGNQVKSAHDMSREFRVLSQLHQIYELAPRPLVFCDDAAVIGAEFYVMERQHGVILRGPTAPDGLANPKKIRQLCQAFVDNLARLHALDYTAAGLGDLGRPDGYVDRQIEGWIKRYDQAKTEHVAELERLASWLDQHRPTIQSTSLIHNDYKYDNLMLNPNDLTQIVALLDWEMTTVGDPWMDLGTTLAYWVQPDDASMLRQHAFGPTLVEGSMSRQEIVDRYLEFSGGEARDPLFYYCYGLFKLGVIVQQIFARFVRGHTQDKRFAKLDRLVLAIGQAGLTAIDRETI